MAVTSLNMDEDLYRNLSEFAERKRLTKGWVINEAVRAYLEGEDRREKRKLETLEALEDIQSGRVVDGEQVLAWLRTWGTDGELPAPRR